MTQRQVEASAITISRSSRCVRFAFSFPRTPFRISMQGVWTKHLRYYLDNADDATRTAKYSPFLGSQYSAILRYSTNADNDIVSSIFFDSSAICLFLTKR